MKIKDYFFKGSNSTGFLKNCNLQIKSEKNNLILEPAKKNVEPEIEGKNVDKFLNLCKQYTSVVFLNCKGVFIWPDGNDIDFLGIKFECSNTTFRILMKESSIHIENLNVNCSVLQIRETGPGFHDVIFDSCNIETNSFLNDYSIPKFIDCKLKLNNSDRYPEIEGANSVHSAWTKLFKDPKKYIKSLDELPSQIKYIRVDGCEGQSYSIYRRSHSNYGSNLFRVKYKDYEWVILYKFDYEKEGYKWKGGSLGSFVHVENNWS